MKQPLSKTFLWVCFGVVLAGTVLLWVVILSTNGEDAPFIYKTY